MIETIILSLLESALRSALLGLVVSAAVGLFRLRDVKTETAIWTLVLAAAIAMPALTAVLPSPLHLRLPAAGATLAMSAPHAAAGRSAFSPPLLLVLAYALGAGLFLARLLAGLILLLRLYLQAEPAPEAWARGKAVRFSAAVDGPLSFAHCILLPADYRLWPETHRAAVMAHEECHIRRGDFFIQLLASVYRALFWFSPFAWWLQKKLGELAETDSDAAGARRIGDAVSYAEILIDVTREAKHRPVDAAVAMAHGPSLAKRVDHLLTQPSGRALGAVGRAAALAAVALTSIGVAEVRSAAAEAARADAAQAIHPSPSPRSQGPRPLSRATRSAAPVRASSSRRRTAGKPPAAQPQTTLAAIDPDQPTYDPLAVLRDHDTVAVLPVVLTGRGLAQ